MAPDTSKRHEFASFSYLFMLLDSGTWGFVQSFTLRSTLPVESSPIGLPENPEFKLVHVRAKKTIPRPSSKTSPRQAPGLGPGACQSIAFHCIPLEDHAEYGTQLSWPQWQCFSGLQSIESPFFCWKANAKANASSAPKVEELALANIFKLIRAAGECWSDGME